jgi:uncharacterized membrane protein YbjE (DUF340 family)
MTLLEFIESHYWSLYILVFVVGITLAGACAARNVK